MSTDAARLPATEATATAAAAAIIAAPHLDHISAEHDAVRRSISVDVVMTVC